MFYAQQTAKGHIGAKLTKCIPTTSENSDSPNNTHSTVEDCMKTFRDENEVE